jgi:hypothetical protein
MRAMRALRALCAAALLARRCCAVPTTLCAVAAAPGAAPACVTRAKHSLEAQRGAPADFGVQAVDYSSCERRATCHAAATALRD